MAGRGPAPKDPGTRARRNKPPVPPVHIDVVPAPQPPLPPRYQFAPDTGERTECSWPAITIEWWKAWGVAPMSAKWTATDWLTALEIAALHAEFWEGNSKIAPELRQRIAKIGGYPDDRKRQGFFDKPDAPTQPQKAGAAPAPAASSRTRRGPLTIIQGEKASGQ